MIELMVVLFLLMFFFTYGEYGFSFKGIWSYKFKDRIMLPCFKEVKFH